MNLRVLVGRFGKVLQQQTPNGTWEDVPVVIDDFYNRSADVLDTSEG